MLRYFAQISLQNFYTFPAEQSDARESKFCSMFLFRKLFANIRKFSTNVAFSWNSGLQYSGVSAILLPVQCLPVQLGVARTAGAITCLSLVFNKTVHNQQINQLIVNLCGGSGSGRIRCFWVTRIRIRGKYRIRILYPEKDSMLFKFFRY